VTARPRSVRLRAYAVGFGDCLLLTVTYGSGPPDGRRNRHMLIDCGTAETMTAGPTLADVAAQVAEHCDGRLDVVVGTHRHRDHASGFGDPEARRILRPLQPRVVVRPWTDMPRARRTDPSLGLDAHCRRFLTLLDGVHSQAQALPRLGFDDAAGARRAQLAATLGIRNGRAATLLEQWGRDGRAEYVRAGDTVVLDEEMPGVTVRVLAPPSGDRLPALVRPGEHWFQLAADGELPSLFDGQPSRAVTDALGMLAEPGGVGAAEWLLRTLHTRRVSQGLEIAEAFDDLAHDTSVVLLVTVGNRTLLLPGGAGTGSWAQVMDGSTTDPRLVRRLAGVDVYKVGGHGARTATPRRLRGLWERRDESARPLVSVLSSRRGVVGAVPDDTLVSDLEELGPVHRTDELPDGVWWMDVAAPTRGPAPFEFTAGPATN
jgi:hypothetical protein